MAKPELSDKKLMTWNPGGKNMGRLYVLSDKNQWEPYTSVVPQHLQQVDANWKSSFAPLSKGYATMQNLLKLGYDIVDGNYKEE